MKKVLITLTFFTTLAFTSNAQDSRSSRSDKDKATSKEVKEQKVEVNGGVAPSTAPQSVEQQPQQTAPAQESKPNKGGTRMAITEKGVPASKNTDATKTQKSTEPKKTEPVKTEKH